MNDNKNQKALKAGAAYTVGNLLVRGIGFLTVPIFARLLSASDYGVINTFSAYSSVLFVVQGLALHSSLKNAKIDYQKQISEYVSSLVIMVLFVTAVFLGVSVLFRDSLAELLALPNPVLVPLLVLEGFSMVMSTYYNSVLALEYKSKEYLLLSLFYSILGIVTSIGFIVYVFQENKYYGRIIGLLLCGLIMSAYILFVLFKASRPVVRFSYWKYALKISLPIVPHGLSQLVLSQFDRVMINKMIGSHEAGLYSFAYNIGSIFTVIATSLDTAWTQWFFDKMAGEEYKKIKNASRYYIWLVSIGVIVLMLIAPELILVLGGKKYIESREVSVVILLSMYYSFLYFFPSSIEYYYKKTKFIALGTVIVAVLNIALNILFIPQYGYIAAAYTTVFCYLLYYGIHIVLSKVICKIEVYNWKEQFLAMLLTTLVAFGTINLIGLWIVRWGIIALISACLCFMIVINRKEILLFIKEWRNI